MTLLETPTVREIENILDRIKFVDKYHRRMNRKLNDIRGAYGDTEIIIGKFIDYCKERMELSSFDSVLYYNYIIRKVNINDNKWANISKFLHDHSYLETTYVSGKCFPNLKTALTWVLSYRMTKLYFDKVIKSLDYEGSWIPHD